MNLPNALSVGRLLSGPVIAAWIIQGNVRLRNSSKSIAIYMRVSILLRKTLKFQLLAVFSFLFAVATGGTKFDYFCGY